jgi:phosphoglycerol transferase MdoB-like AlkP superfamily enzyme
MFRKIFTSKRMLWIWGSWLLILLIMSLMRAVFYFKFSQGSGASGSFLPVWWMGFRFDLRIASIILFPVLVLSSFTFGNPFKRKAAKIFWLTYLGIAGFALLLFYTADFQYYGYRHARLDAELIGFMEDAGISMQMVWQSYPVVRILLLLVAGIFLWVWVNRKMMKLIASRNFIPARKAIIISFTATVLVFVFCCWGRMNLFPLRWSDAASLQNDFKAQMALNPFESFLSSLRFRNEQPDIEKVKQFYPVMASALKLPVADTFPSGYSRQIPATINSNNKKPNVVLVLCESFSYYKTSMCGNPLNPTPYFDSLSKQGIFFSNCFTPAYGTARGVWATLTGTPDVTFIKTASRNPRAVDQHCIINNFNGYSKQYFIGGSASWANIRGLIQNNIADLRLYEEQDYRSPKRDVWGISDKDLVMEAIQVINKEQQPFFSIIQTANNHRPYTIPEEDAAEMGMLQHPLDSLLRYGFNVNSNADDTNEEYNAMRYMDFCIKKLMQEAAKQPWFNETIFLFIGDHGIRGNAGTLVPNAYTEKGLTCEHVPLLIYSPMLKNAAYPFVCSQVDVLPTLAGLAGISYTNTTLGRDLLQLAKDSTAQKFAFIIDHDTKNYGVIWNNYYYSKEIKGKREGFASIQPNAPAAPPVNQQPAYRQLAGALLETSRYLIYNNKKKPKTL